ncbi:MAG: pyridoxamine 5'-phosphate oxidase [Pseudomonadota bacterium]
MASNYADQRRDYTMGGLSDEDMPTSPFELFGRWLEQAVDASLADPTAMALSTIDAEGRPWQRLVLLKGFSSDGFVFYTNYGSEKAEAISRESRVSLLFPWNELERQVIVGGRAEKVVAAESAAYFLSRPEESQLAAWASRQSRPISSKAVLEQAFSDIKAKFAHGDIPVPDFWGGYRVVPERIEFWQGGAHRLHDRYRYTLADDGDWHWQRLQP